MQIERLTADWHKFDEVSEDPLCSKEFAMANLKKGEVYFLVDGENHATVIIKKKMFKALSRAQILTESYDIYFLKEIITFLTNQGIPYARIGNTMSGFEKIVDLPNSKVIERNTFVINLSNSEEEIWKSFDKKIRNAIRKAEKEKVKIFEITDEKEIKDYYDMSLITEKNIKKRKGRRSFSMPDIYFFKNIFNSKIGRFLVARLGNKIIAGALFLTSKNRVIYYQSFSSRDYTEKQAPSLIQWEAIKLFKKIGIGIYDLGGITLNLEKDDSRFFIYEFKRKFNGEIKKFYNFEIELNHWKKIQDYILKTIYGKKL